MRANDKQEGPIPVSIAEYPTSPPLQRIWSPADARDTVRDTMQLAALKRLHHQLEHDTTVWETLVTERALLGTLPKPVGRLAPIDKLLADWPAPVVCAVIIP